MLRIGHCADSIRHRRGYADRLPNRDKKWLPTNPLLIVSRFDGRHQLTATERQRLTDD